MKNKQTPSGFFKNPFSKYLPLLKNDERGVSAVEFALIAPILLLIYMGTLEVSQGLTVSRNNTNIASTVADLIGQTTSVTPDDVNTIFEASKAIISPFQSGYVSVIASSYCKIQDPSNSANTIIVRDWIEKYQAGTTADPGDTDNDGSEVGLPSAVTVTDPSLIALLPNKGDSLIVAESQYSYGFISPARAIFKLINPTTAFGESSVHGETGGFTVKDRFFVRPRNVRNVILKDASNTPSKC